MKADGQPIVLRQIPTGALIPGVISILPSGTYLDVDILLSEVKRLHLDAEHLAIDPWASVITGADREGEVIAGLPARIGSTGSGTGKALQRRIERLEHILYAKDIPELRQFVRPTDEILVRLLQEGRRVVVEGTQGFGLSLLHSGHFPFVTSRDTTAAAAIAESNVSPLYVDQVTLVLRAFPIRVGGNSGPLPGEVDWDTIVAQGEHDHEIVERASVTQRVRRVGRFQADIVLRAIAANRPTNIVLNHLDYVDHECCITRQPTALIKSFVSNIEEVIGREVDMWGMGPGILIGRSKALEALTTMATSKP